MTQTPPPTAIETVSDERLLPDRALAYIAEEARLANAVIALGRDKEGQGYVKVATAMHRIAARASEALIALSRRSVDTADGVEVAWPGRKFCEIAERNAWELAKFIKGEDDKQVVSDAALAIKTLLTSRSALAITEPEREPVAWQHRSRVRVDAQYPWSKWGKWTTGRARVTTLLSPTAEYEERPLFASPPAQEAVTDEMCRLAMIELSAHWERTTQPTMEIARAVLTEALQLGKEG